MGNESSNPSSAGRHGQGRRRRWPSLAVAAIAAAAIAGVLYAGAPVRAGVSSDAGPEHLAVLVAIALLIVAFAHGCGWLARRLGQPALLGQVCAGILLGPSLLGWVSPGWASLLLPMPLQTTLRILAESGIALYLLRFGLQLRQTGSTAHHRLPRLLPAVAFALGWALAIWLYPWFGHGGTPGLVAFGMIVGSAFALAAPSVAAGLLEKAAPGHTALGRWARAQGETSEPWGWLLPLAVAAILLGNRLPPALAIGYALAVACAALLAHPWLARQAGRDLGARLGLKLALLVVAATALGEPLGLAAPFGALAAGLLIGAASRPAQALDRVLQPLQALLLPAFFLGVGLHIDVFSAAPAALLLIGGTALATAWAARLAGALTLHQPHRLSWRETLAAAAALNAPGALALLALQLGLERGALPLPLYSTLAIAALSAPPLATLALKLLLPQSPATTRRCVLLYRIAP